MPFQPNLKQRIGLLDSFRYLAILMVACYHYYFRFYTIYPYGAKYRHFVFFEYGYMGVELFFMISGFVILMTLERSKNIQQFFARRLIRLFPTMVVCSILTYLTFLLLDHQNKLPTLHSPVSSFIPSWTFSEPYFWSLLLGQRITYIDGAYWSLAVEVKFYIVVAALYFFSGKNFFRNWLIVVTLSLAIRMLVQQHLLTGTFARLSDIILFPKYIVLFTLGMFFFKLYKGEKIKATTLAAVVLFAFCQIFLVRLVNNTWIEKVYLTAFIGLFLLFLYKSRWLTFLDFSFLQRSGQASYALYLLHENIGLFFIVSLSTFTGLPLPLLPVIVFIFLTFFALMIFVGIELPLTKVLRRRFISP